MINRGLIFKLYPDAQTECAFRHYAGVCRLVYNLSLEQRDTWGRRERIGYVRQASELTALRAEFEFIREVHVTPLQQALRDLDRAFTNFFKDLKKPTEQRHFRYPTPRKKGLNDSFRFQGREIKIETLNAKWSRVRLPKIGWVKFRRTRELLGKLKNATVSRDALGWHIAFSMEIDHEARTNDLPSVGIDRGVTIAVATSDGDMRRMPASLKRLDALHRRAQRSASRRKRGSSRWKKAQARAAKIKARGARIRKHFNHILTTDLARRYGVAVLEDLKVRSMIKSARGTQESPGKRVKQKAGLNRSIAEQSWRQFESFLDYKLAERGGHMLKVDPRYTSQECSACGVTDKESRESQSLFRCRHCGHEQNADVNAAVNIKRRGNTALLPVEDAGCGACEAGSAQEAA